MTLHLLLLLCPHDPRACQDGHQHKHPEREGDVRVGALALAAGDGDGVRLEERGGEYEREKEKFEGWKMKGDRRKHGRIIHCFLDLMMGLII